MSEVDLDSSQINIAQQFQRYVDPKAPPALRMMAAKGLAPAPPRELLHILLRLMSDTDQTVAESARQTLDKYPEKMVRIALNDQSHPLLLDHLARTRADSQGLIEDLLVFRQLPLETLKFLAESVNEQLLTMISNNQQRLLMSPELLQSIKKNSVASQGLIDRVESFLRLNGMLQEEEGEEGSEDDFPDELLIEGEGEEEALPSWKRRPSPEEESAEPDMSNLWGYIDSLGIGGKIKLATVGNATARSILIRSQNKLIAMSTIRSPRMTLKEASGIAGNRNVIEDVLRHIASNKQWVRRYEIQLALVNNPKTPVPISMKLIYGLRTFDLKALVKNRNVPVLVSKRAKTIVTKRTK